MSIGFIQNASDEYVKKTQTEDNGLYLTEEKNSNILLSEDEIVAGLYFGVNSLGNVGEITFAITKI